MLFISVTSFFSRLLHFIPCHHRLIVLSNCDYHYPRNYYLMSKSLSLLSKKKDVTSSLPSQAIQTKPYPASFVDEKIFKSTCTVYALKTPKHFCNNARSLLKKHVLRLMKQPSIIKPHINNTDSDDDHDDDVDGRVKKKRKMETGKQGEEELLILLKYLSKPAVGLRQCGHQKQEAVMNGKAKDMLIGNMVDAAVGKPDALVSLLKAELGESYVEQNVKNTATRKDAQEQRVRDWLIDRLGRSLNGLDKEEMFKEYDVKVGYGNYSMDTVLRTLLPREVAPPTSFETAGHIAHLNLREEHVLWKYVIGKVLIDKHKPRIRTVVNKLESTGGPYRTFKMEVIAGEDEMMTEVSENSCRFRLNFAEVYWNSRLETEHRRIVASLKSSDILADAFCGIGPFVLPAVKLKRCVAFANDLNPASVHFLKKNAKRNGIGLRDISPLESQEDSSQTPGVCISCGCARDFLKNLILDHHIGVTVIVMNFPSGAPEFLDVFRGLYKSREKLPLPLIHCYCFSSAENWEKEARERIISNLYEANGKEDKGKFQTSDIAVRLVRDVSPKKRQVCASFRLPSQVAYGDESHSKCN